MVVVAVVKGGSAVGFSSTLGILVELAAVRVSEGSAAPDDSEGSGDFLFLLTAASTASTATKAAPSTPLLNKTKLMQNTRIQQSFILLHPCNPNYFFMAQGFKRTGNSFSAKKQTAANTSKASTVIKKGARYIAPKKHQAQVKAALTAKWTANLNRRAETALITRIGTHSESALRLVKAEKAIVEELKKKEKKKGDKSATAAAPGGDQKATTSSSGKDSEMGTLAKSAVAHMNALGEVEANFDESESDDEEEIVEQ